MMKISCTFRIKSFIILSFTCESNFPWLAGAAFISYLLSPLPPSPNLSCQSNQYISFIFFRLISTFNLLLIYLGFTDSSRKQFRNTVQNKFQALKYDKNDSNQRNTDKYRKIFKGLATLKRASLQIQHTCAKQNAGPRRCCQMMDLMRRLR